MNINNIKIDYAQITSALMQAKSYNDFLKIDEGKFINEYNSTKLKMLAGFIDSLNIEKENLVLMEFGSLHHKPEFNLSDKRNAGLAYFFALNKEKTGLEYLAFEPEFDESTLKKYLFNEKSPVYSKFNNSERNNIFENICAVTIRNYEDAKIITTSSDKVSVIFSNQVLNCPNLYHKFDFWNLKGVHLHTGDELELAMNGAKAVLGEEEYLNYKADQRFADIYGFGDINNSFNFMWKVN